jgi:hypothetical protein
MSSDLLDKLHQLAERRQAHFSDLHNSGRWRHYYASENEVIAVVRDAERATDNWKQMTQPD